jgi:nucleoside-diphosphate-sugar epimerase
LCSDYFFDRIVRGLPVPIPGDGTQLVSLTNSRDVASLLAAPVNHEAAAIEQRIFNCGTDQLVSYNDVARMCSQIAGVEDVVIEHYDPELFEKTVFPFRNTNFYVDPSTAKKLLGWPGPQHDLASDLPAYFADYQARGGPTKKMSLRKDWEICVGSKTPPQGYSESIYDKYDPLILETTSAKN